MVENNSKGKLGRQSFQGLVFFTYLFDVFFH